MFDEVDNAPLPGGNGKYFSDGKYKVRLEKFTRGKSQQGKGEFTVAEFTILDVLVGYEGSNQPGERVSWVQLKSWQPFASNMKGFIAAVTGTRVEDGDLVDPVSGRRMKASDALMTASNGDGTAFAGAILIADASGVRTKKNQPFTKVIWESGEEDEEITSA